MKLFLRFIPLVALVLSSASFADVRVAPNGDAYIKRLGQDDKKILSENDSGYVGIGTSSPTDNLYIKSDETNGSPGITIENSLSAGSGSTGSTEIQLTSATRSASILLGGPYGGTFQDSLTIYGATSVDIEFWTNGSQSGYITTSGDWYRTDNESAWSTTSDIRLKNVISDLPYGLNEISKINPFFYKFKETNPQGLDPKKIHVGMSAQELEKLIPEAVKTDGMGYKSITNDPIFWSMINAIKELKMLSDQQKQWICSQADAPEQLCM